MLLNLYSSEIVFQLCSVLIREYQSIHYTGLGSLGSKRGQVEGL